MALELFDSDEPMEPLDWAAAGRACQPKAMTPAYEGVGDELAQPDLVCGVAELAGLGPMGPGGTDPHHPLEP